MVTITWLRFFAYFLLIKRVSKLIITLIAIMWNTISFIFLSLCELILAATIFTMRFGSIRPDLYGGQLISMRVLYDAMVSNYGSDHFGAFTRAHDALLIVHLIIAHIFLINFLVAILSTIYNNMLA